MIQLTMSEMVGRYVVQPSRKSTARRLLRTYRKYKDNPLVATGEAIAKGYAISKIDGPLPFLDVVGVGYAVFDAGQAWYDYFTS